jgi:uncharacterized protein YndB with AHSA1/START domain
MAGRTNDENGSFAGELTLHLARVLPAPRPPIFTMLSQPDELARWWGPKGLPLRALPGTYASEANIES